MLKNKQSLIAVVAGAAVIGLGAYWYFSPYLALYQLRQAAQARNAADFNARVDFPRLRENLKLHLDPGSGGGAIGNVLGRFVIDKVVDAAVRPEAVMRAVDSMPANPDVAPGGETPGKSQWTTRRQGMNRIVAFDSAREPGKRVGIVFERTGFADWKLTDIEPPAKQLSSEGTP